jgi:hypothetical protein
LEAKAYRNEGAVGTVMERGRGGGLGRG